MVYIIDQHGPVNLIAALVEFFFRWKITGAAVGIAAEIKRIIMEQFRDAQGKFHHHLVGDAAQTAVSKGKVLHFNIFCLLMNTILEQTLHLIQPVCPVNAAILPGFVCIFP